MTGLIITIHIIVCTLLIIIILIQRGRGGGLAESFSDVETMFGTKTNAFLTRTTTVLSILFFITCLSLAVLSVRQSRSLMKGAKIQGQAAQTFPLQKEKIPEQLPAQSGQTQEPQGSTPQEAPKQQELPKGQ